MFQSCSVTTQSWQILNFPLLVPIINLLSGCMNWCTAKTCHLRCCAYTLRTLWFNVIKSPKFSARGTAPPLRLLHGDLRILVLWQISQFRSSRKWVSTLCLRKSSLLLDVGSRDTSWEELACESVFKNFIHQILSKFLQPLLDFRTHRVSPFNRGFF